MKMASLEPDVSGIGMHGDRTPALSAGASTGTVTQLCKRRYRRPQPSGEVGCHNTQHCVMGKISKDFGPPPSSIKEYAEMMPLSRSLAPLLVAAFAAACGISSVSDDGTPKLGVAEAPARASSAAPAKPAASQAVALDKAAQAYTAIADPKSKAYKIGPLDVLEVTVFKVPDLSKSVQVSEAGTINFPLIGEIRPAANQHVSLSRSSQRGLGLNICEIRK